MSRNLGRLSKAERKYVTEHCDDVINAIMKEGDDAHNAGKYREEASCHRSIQDVLVKKGQKFKYTDEGMEAFGWNSLWSHSYVAARQFETYGKNFDDMVYYDGKGHYYLTPEAKEFADLHGIEYLNSGISSLVPPGGYGSSHSRDMGRMTGGGYESSHSSYERPSEYRVHSSSYSVPAYGKIPYEPTYGLYSETPYAPYSAPSHSRPSIKHSSDPSNWYRPDPAGPMVHRDTGRPYDHTKPSNQQGYATSPDETVYYPI
jgi:hypothetical protein